MSQIHSSSISFSFTIRDACGVLFVCLFFVLFVFSVFFFRALSIINKETLQKCFSKHYSTGKFELARFWTVTCF